jgi:hypothetical protein
LDVCGGLHMNTEGIIAYRGNVTLEKAVWDNITGMTVILDLEQRPHELTAANPFKKFTKMRKGRVGTRFSVVMMRGELAIYEDEMMLKGWSDGTNGWRVTFWLQGTDGLVETHPFMDFDKGEEFALVAVELDDDNEAIDQVKREKLETATKGRKQGLSNYAAMLCRTPEFHEYLISLGTFAVPERVDEGIVKNWMCETLAIDSRAELDTDEVAIASFHKRIRIPYAEWNSQQA